MKIVFSKVALAALLIAGICTSVTAAESKKPNLVFILVDDMGWTDVGCYGSKFYESPNVDKLASQGMKFTQAYAACPVCSPTRASIMTGKYPARLHLTDWLPGRTDRPNQKLMRPNFLQHLPLEETTIAEALKQAGYATGAFGKWHLGGQGFMPQQQGFDTYFEGSMTGSSPGSTEPEKGEYDITSAAIKFIEEHKDQPFFAYVPYYSVHIPLHARQQLIAKYEAKPHSEGHHTNAIYAAMVESLDTNIGRILQKLDELKLSDNTVVIFTSDNGGLSVHEGQHTPATSNFPLRAGKGYLYEGGVREPLIVRWPGVVTPGSTCTNQVISVDYFPTLLDIAGGSNANAVDGVSIAPLLKHKGELKPRELYWHYPHYANQGGAPGGAIREGDYKLIEFYDEGRWELYNVANDPGEKTNVVHQHWDVANKMEAKLDSWRRSVGAQMMLPNPNYDPAAKRTLTNDTP